MNIQALDLYEKSDQELIELKASMRPPPGLR